MEMKDPDLEGAQTLLREQESTRARGMVQMPFEESVKDILI